MHKLVLLFVIISIPAVYTQCQALVLQDGNDFVYFEAGAASILRDLYDYDVISATGFASLVGVQLSQNLDSPAIEAYWKNFGRNDVLKSWPLGLSQGLFLEQSLYNTKILQETTQKLVSGKLLGKKLSILATDLNTGKAAFFTESSADLAIGVAGSASQPGFFQPVSYNDKSLASGYMVTNSDFDSVISMCNAMGKQKITIDTIMVNSKKLMEKQTDKYRAYQMLRRYLEINSYVKTMESYVHTVTDYPNVSFRHFIYPLSNLKYTQEPFANSPEVTSQMYDQGRSNTQEILKNVKLSEDVMEQFEKDFEDMYHLDDESINKLKLSR